jgi:2-iminobutanoate/2-iminopropanoate deaminase
MNTVTPLLVPGLPPPVSHYADATIANGFLFVSGMIAADAKGELVGAGDAGAQAAFIFDLIAKSLAAVGASFVDVAKLTVFLTNIEDRRAVNEIRKAVFGAHKPASSLVEISRLVIPGALVEVEAIAVIPSGS